MILIKIKAIPTVIQKDLELENAFKDLKVWSRNVRGKLVAQKDDIINALRIKGALEAVKSFLDKNILQLEFDSTDCEVLNP